MTYRTVVASVALLCPLLAPASPQAPDPDPQEAYSHVLDLLFPLNLESEPTYYLKLVLRFHDDESQLVLVVYPGRKSKLVRSSLDHMNANDLFQLATKTLAQNPREK
jgi:hypothetical protein